MHARTHTRILAHAIFFVYLIYVHIYIYTLIDRDRPINNIFLLLLNCFVRQSCIVFPPTKLHSPPLKTNDLKKN